LPISFSWPDCLYRAPTRRKNGEEDRKSHQSTSLRATALRAHPRPQSSIACFLPSSIPASLVQPRGRPLAAPTRRRARIRRSLRGRWLRSPTSADVRPARPSRRRIGHRESLLVRQNHDVQTVHRDIDADIARFAHLRTPSLLMRARALAIVRVWKRRPGRRAHSPSDSQSAFELPAVAGIGS